MTSTVAHSIRQHLGKITYIISAVAMALGVAGGLLASGGAAGAATTSHASPSATARHYSAVAAVTHSAVNAAGYHSATATTPQRLWLVQTGNTLSGIAASSGLPVTALEGYNPQIHDPNYIVDGQYVALVAHHRNLWAPAVPVAPVTAVAPAASGPSQLPVTPTPGNSTPQTPTEQPSTPQYQAPQQATPAPTPGPAPVQQQSAPTTSGFSIPGLSAAQSACIAFRESTNGTNPAANDGGTPNYFGIIPASGKIVSGMSLAQQEQVAGQLVQQAGGASPWAADGCPGT